MGEGVRGDDPHKLGRSLDILCERSLVRERAPMDESRDVVPDFGARHVLTDLDYVPGEVGA